MFIKQDVHLQVSKMLRPHRARNFLVGDEMSRRRLHRRIFATVGFSRSGFGLDLQRVGSTRKDQGG
jgi:hypothetical protein